MAEKLGLDEESYGRFHERLCHYMELLASEFDNVKYQPARLTIYKWNNREDARLLVEDARFVVLEDGAKFEDPTEAAPQTIPKITPRLVVRTPEDKARLVLGALDLLRKVNICSRPWPRACDPRVAEMVVNPKLDGLFNKALIIYRQHKVTIPASLGD